VEVGHVSLGQLSWHFFIVSLVAFGAATSVAPEIHHVLVESSHVMSHERFAGLFAMSQAAPGTNVMFVTVLGWQVAGLSGAFATTISFLGPTGLIALAVERFGTQHREARWHVMIRRALPPITIGLLLSTGVLLARTAISPVGLALALTATIVLTWSKLTPLWLTVVGAVLGAAGFV
jgi:chromate transporter